MLSQNLYAHYSNTSHLYDVHILKLTLTVLKIFNVFFTRTLFYLCNFAPTNYDNRLKRFGLQRLKLCRIIHDICFMFKLTHCLTDFNLHHAICYAPNVGTKGHRYKLYIAHARKLIPSTHFMHCIMPMWNFLPDQCFSPDTYNAFRTKICKIDFSRFLVCEF